MRLGDDSFRRFTTRAELDPLPRTAQAAMPAPKGHSKRANVSQAPNAVRATSFANRRLGTSSQLRTLRHVPRALQPKPRLASRTSRPRNRAGSILTHNIYGRGQGATPCRHPRCSVHSRGLDVKCSQLRTSSDWPTSRTCAGFSALQELSGSGTKAKALLRPNSLAAGQKVRSCELQRHFPGPRTIKSATWGRDRRARSPGHSLQVTLSGPVGQQRVKVRLRRPSQRFHRQTVTGCVSEGPNRPGPSRCLREATHQPAGRRRNPRTRGNADRSSDRGWTSRESGHLARRAGTRDRDGRPSRRALHAIRVAAQVAWSSQLRTFRRPPGASMP